MGHRQFVLYTRAMTDQPPKLLDQVRNFIRVKHYSIRTEQAYTGWINASFFSMTSDIRGTWELLKWSCSLLIWRRRAKVSAPSAIPIISSSRAGGSGRTPGPGVENRGGYRSVWWTGWRGRAFPVLRANRRMIAAHGWRRRGEGRAGACVR